MNDTVRIVICGARGAGKSTMIGALAPHCGSLHHDEPSAVTAPFNEFGVFGNVAYAVMRVRGRTILVADVSAGEQSVRDIAAAGVSADLAVIVVDASVGMRQQTRQLSVLASLLRIPNIVAAVNKIDRVGYSRDVFAAIEREYRDFATRAGVSDVTCVPVSALRGDNVVDAGSNMRWYEGPTLLEHLEQVPVTVTQVDDRDVFRSADDRETAADRFESTIIWLHHEPMLQGRSYLMKVAEQTTNATVAPIKYKIETDTMQHLPAKRLHRGDIGVCHLELTSSVTFESYNNNRRRGAFVLIDSAASAVAGVGLLDFALRRSENVRWQLLELDKQARAGLKRQRPCVLWFTGLSGAGKSTIANLVEKRLHALGYHTYLLDGDNVRHGLTKDLGFTDADRVENIRRISEVARLMVDAGLIVLVSFISPFRAERRMARALLEPGEFVEVYVDTPLALAEARDPKGLYEKARRGELKNFTGLDSPYEAPEHPELRIETAQVSAEQAAGAILDYLEKAQIVASER